MIFTTTAGTATRHWVASKRTVSLPNRATLHTAPSMHSRSVMICYSP
ncbi:hypothetical protein SNARM312S_06943 [Streptomyces narbonensis]